MPTNVGGTAWSASANTQDLNFDAELLSDFNSVDDQIVIKLSDTADMLQGIALPADLYFINIGPDNSVVSNTVNVVTTNYTLGVAGAPGTPVTATTWQQTGDGNAPSTTPDNYAEASIIMSLGTDHKAGTTVNVSTGTNVTGGAINTAAALGGTADQILTLETPSIGNASGAASLLLPSDFLLRVEQTPGMQKQDFNVAAGYTPIAAAGGAAIANAAQPTNAQVNAEVVYKGASDSQDGAMDNLVNFSFSNDVLNFSSLGLASYAKDYDAVKNGIQIDELLKVVPGSFSTSTLNGGFAPDVAQNPDLFNNNGKVLFVLEAQTTAVTGSTDIQASGSYHLYVDANHSGSYEAGSDMVINFTTENSAITGATFADAQALVKALVGTPGDWTSVAGSLAIPATPTTPAIPAVTPINIIGTQVTTDPAGLHIADSLFML
jgi:hypothetical protein